MSVAAPAATLPRVAPWSLAHPLWLCPFRSFFTILRCVFELFWLTWKTRRSQRSRTAVAKTAQEDGTL